MPRSSSARFTNMQRPDKPVHYDFRLIVITNGKARGNQKDRSKGRSNEAIDSSPIRDLEGRRIRRVLQIVANGSSIDARACPPHLYRTIAVHVRRLRHHRMTLEATRCRGHYRRRLCILKLPNCPAVTTSPTGRQERDDSQEIGKRSMCPTTFVSTLSTLRVRR